MQQYISWGFIQGNIIDPTTYVFISGLGEFLGMFFFILLMVGVLLNFNLSKSKAHKKRAFGWIVLGISISLLIGLLIALGFQYGIFTKYYGINQTDVFSMASLALNPAIVIASMLKGANYYSSHVTFYIPVGNGFVYLVMQLLGAILGAYVAYLFFKRLIKKEKNASIIKDCFYTRPSICNLKANYFNEFLATFILVLTIISINLLISANHNVFIIMLVCIIVAGIGYGLGGTTGYALNPFRDLGPRIVYSIIFRKQDKDIKSDWKYVQVPIVATTVGAIFATIVLPGFLY